MGESRVAMVEVQAEGHHPFYLRLVSQAFSEGSWSLAYGLNGKTAILARLQEAAGEWMPGSTTQILTRQLKPGKWTLTREIGRWLRREPADLLFFNSFDLIASSWCRWAAFGWRPPRHLRGRIAGFYLRPRFLEPDAGGLGNFWKRLGFGALAREGWFRRLLVLDEYLQARIEPRFRAPLAWVPDPWDGDFTICAEEARRKWGLPTDGRVLLHFGTGSPRKGLPALIEALENLPPDQRPFLLCCGQLDLRPEWKQRLQRLEHTRVHDRYLSETERIEVFRAADLVALLYRGHYGSSGVLVNAAAAGRPVIAINSGLIGQRVNEHRLGLAIEESGGELVEALARCASNETPLADPTDLRAFAKAHSPTEFKAALLRAFEHVEA